MKKIKCYVIIKAVIHYLINLRYIYKWNYGYIILKYDNEEFMAEESYLEI